MSMKKEITEEKREVTVPKAWFERLVEIADMVEKSQGPTQETYVAMLIGYTSSAKAILKYN